MDIINNIRNFIEHNVSTIIALCALFVTIYEAWSIRRHNKLSVKPHITTFTYRHKNSNKSPSGETISTGTIVIELLNNGLGPAVIQDFKVLFDNIDTGIKNIEDAETISTRVLKGKIVNHKAFEIFNKDYHFAAKEKKCILQIVFPILKTQSFEDFVTLISRLSLVINYKSLYGKKFKYDSRD